ncbi:hypothetical protein FQZ97_819390 [compost metagenome]
MGKPCFIALRVERTCSYSGTSWHTHDYVGILPPAIMNFSEVIDDLVEAYRCKIGKLHFHHGFISFDGQPQCSTDNGTLT